jgi:hypothetical protein
MKNKMHNNKTIKNSIVAVAMVISVKQIVIVRSTSLYILHTLIDTNSKILGTSPITKHFLLFFAISYY